MKVISGDEKEQIGKLLSLDRGNCIVDIRSHDSHSSEVKMFPLNQLCKLGTDVR